MILYSSQRFLNILRLIHWIIALAGLSGLAEGRRGLLLATVFSGVILYGLERRSDWIAGAIRLWAGLSFLAGLLLFLLTVSATPGINEKIPLFLLALFLMGFGWYVFDVTPRYIIEVPSDVADSDIEDKPK